MSGNRLDSSVQRNFWKPMVTINTKFNVKNNIRKFSN